MKQGRVGERPGMYLRDPEVGWNLPTPAAASSDAAPLVDAPSHAPTVRIFPPRKTLPVVNLHRVDLHAVTQPQVVQHILDELDAERGGFVVTPNLDHLRRCVKDLAFSALVAEADVVVADGMPLVWAARIQGTPLPARVAGSDLIWTLSAAAAEAGRSIYMLGGSPGTADAAAKVLQEKSPSLKVAGTSCPSVGFDQSDSELLSIVEAFRQCQPDIVFVALGSPKQELLIERIRRMLPRTWFIGVGISFSFVCGDVRRAPNWAQKIGLEWMHRFLQEPRRLFKRYFVHGLPFALNLIGHAAVRRATRKFRRATNLSRYSAMLRNGNGNGNGHKANGNGHGNGHSGNGHSNGHSNGNGVIASGATAIDNENAPATRVSTLEPQTNLSPTMRLPESVTTTPRAETPNHHVRALSRLRSLVLLGGSVRATELSASVGRSTLDLPVDEAGSILNHWLMHSAELAHYAALDALPVRVMVNRNSPEPTTASARYQGTFQVERDQSELRGTGGVLRDLAQNYDDDDLVLVANAAQLLLDPLSVIASGLDHKRGDIALISHQDGTPSGVMLIRCKTLRAIPATGFIDMKEQALPLIAQKFDVKVMHCRRHSGLPIRSLADYINALRQFHRRKIGKPASTDPLAEDWARSFAIVEDGAIVDPRAHVHDSVVLKGAVVEAGGTLVRSIVCPGGVVRQKSTVVDQFVCVVK